MHQVYALYMSLKDFRLTLKQGSSPCSILLKM
nr:MAG TPA: hypothetical protein [Caudoviricetes sp.]